MLRKIRHSLKMIERELATASNPAVACSFGKDSMAVLWMVRRYAPEIPVLYCEAIPHPTKHKFMEQVTADYGLNVIKSRPLHRDVILGGDNVEIIEVHQLGIGCNAYFPIEAFPGSTPDKDSTCGLAMLTERIPSTYSTFDAVFIGHRGDDVDPTHGAIPLQAEVFTAGEFRYVYPLRDWTEADVWEASRILKVPQNTRRYHDGDLTANNDYYDLCTACLCQRDDAESVVCPKTGSDFPVLFKADVLASRRQAWRDSLVNIV